jgi:hypothetical protein
LERGSPLALGYLDVRHDGIRAELKVERKTPVTHETAPWSRKKTPVSEESTPRSESL